MTLDGTGPVPGRCSARLYVVIACVRSAAVRSRPFLKSAGSSVNVSRDQMREREKEWSVLMQSANAGDRDAYLRLLCEIAPVLRRTTERELVRVGLPVDRKETIVQQILLAVHLKRHTWDTSASFCFWLFSIARKKLSDATRRNPGGIDCFATPLEPALEALKVPYVNRLIRGTRVRHRALREAVISEGASSRGTANGATTTEGGS